MRKIITLTIALILTASLSACSSETETIPDIKEEVVESIVEETEATETVETVEEIETFEEPVAGEGETVIKWTVKHPGFVVKGYTSEEIEHLDIEDGVIYHDGAEQVDIIIAKEYIRYRSLEEFAEEKAEKFGGTVSYIEEDGVRTALVNYSLDNGEKVFECEARYVEEDKMFAGICYRYHADISQIDESNAED